MHKRYVSNLGASIVLIATGFISAINQIYCQVVLHTLDASRWRALIWKCNRMNKRRYAIYGRILASLFQTEVTIKITRGGYQNVY